MSQQLASILLNVRTCKTCDLGNFGHDTIGDVRPRQLQQPWDFFFLAQRLELVADLWIKVPDGNAEDNGGSAMSRFRSRGSTDCDAKRLQQPGDRAGRREFSFCRWLNGNIFDKCQDLHGHRHPFFNFKLRVVIWSKRCLKMNPKRKNTFHFFAFSLLASTIPTSQLWADRQYYLLSIFLNPWWNEDVVKGKVGLIQFYKGLSKK